MQTFTITFGIAEESVTLTDQGKDILEILNSLKQAGWELEHITNITKI